ncbi:MAG: glycosyl hydrolase [Clostridia bacterium]
MDARLIDQARWRQAGPFRGGRVVAVAGDPGRAGTFYFGGVAGGVWRTDDAAMTWRNVSDGYFKASSVGALAVSASEPAVLYAGMGEACIRGNVVAGDGVWRSPDGGLTWEHRGLADTQHIARVRVHPRNPDVVYVAAFGHAYGPNEDRGVFRSDDGGRHWERILYRNDHVGAIDLVMDPERPNLLYAALWDAHRTPWSLESGGPGSGIFRSTDGGSQWEELTGRPGLPVGLQGRIGLAVAAGTGRVWAIVEAADGGLFRSDDGGEHWGLMTDNPDLKQRPFYYMHLFSHPTDPDTVYCLNLGAWRSRDGGRTFEGLPTPHGDNHDLWIDPHNPDRMIEGNDGGASVSFNGGRTWTLPYNQPTGQFYHVTTDREFPYRIYGAQQDNSTLSFPVFSDKGFITAGETYPVGGGESGYIAVRPDAPHIVYAGNYASRMTRYDHRSHQEVDITAWPEDPIGYGGGDLRYRVQWTFPLVLSPHDPNILYTSGNVVFQSSDGGDSWTPISPDLTRADPKTMRSSGGPITKDNVSTEMYATVFALAESPVTPGIIWAGSDDGLVHITRNAGASWTDVTPPELPEWALISIIEPSPHDALTAFVAATRYKSDDRRPYLFETRDGGATWRDITGDLPHDDFTRVIRQDPVVADLLYVGTESGVYASEDGGRHWRRFGGLPVVPVHDLAVHDSDLIAATHGRSFWILDDLSALREAGAADPGRLHLYPTRPVYRLRAGRRFRRTAPADFHQYRQAGGEMVVGESVDGRFRPLNAGENPESGAIFTVSLPVAQPVRVRVYDAGGTVIREASSGPDGWGASLPETPGLHRIVWDLRVESGVSLPDGTLSAYWGGSTIGPRVVPGRYQLEVEQGDSRARVDFEVRPDPRLDTTPEDFQAQFDLLIAIRDKLSEIHRTVLASRDLADTILRYAGMLEEGGSSDLARSARTMVEAIREAAGRLNESRSRGNADSFNYPPKVNSKLASLESTVSFGDARPPAQCYTVFETLVEEADGALRDLRQHMRTARDVLEPAIRESGVPLLGTASGAE